MNNLDGNTLQTLILNLPATTFKYIKTHHVGQVYCAMQAMINTALAIKNLVKLQFVDAYKNLLALPWYLIGMLNPLSGLIITFYDGCKLLLCNPIPLYVFIAAAAASNYVRGDLSGFEISFLNLV